MERWLLPEGVEESLPPEAWRLERARRCLLDLYRSWGYDLIRPPLIEFLDALLTGAGHDLDLETFKLTDQLSGRMMGVRSDMTTQAARIDAHSIKQSAVARYSYIGSVLRTRPDGMGGSRTPLQVGAELFGSDSVQADLEIIGLMLASLESLGLKDISVDLGHVAIYRALESQANLSLSAEQELFDILQRKAVPDLQVFASKQGLPEKLTQSFKDLIQLNGGLETLDLATQRLAGSGEEVLRALSTLSDTAKQLSARYPDLPIHIDLAELRGYRYKTGIVFAAFVPGQGREVARGGRYDGIGASFGRARPATGFSADLNALADLSAFDETSSAAERILAPANGNAQLSSEITALRAQGCSVLISLAENGLSEEAASLGCSSVLIEKAGQWVKQAV